MENKKVEFDLDYTDKYLELKSNYENDKVKELELGEINAIIMQLVDMAMKKIVLETATDNKEGKSPKELFKDLLEFMTGYEASAISSIINMIHNNNYLEFQANQTDKTPLNYSIIIYNEDDVLLSLHYEKQNVNNDLIKKGITSLYKDLVDNSREKKDLKQLIKEQLVEIEDTIYKYIDNVDMEEN